MDKEGEAKVLLIGSEEARQTAVRLVEDIIHEDDRPQSKPP